jgi:hypothetical protein
LDHQSAGHDRRPSLHIADACLVSPIRDHAFLTSRSSSACSASTSFRS